MGILKISANINKDSLNRLRNSKNIIYINLSFMHLLHISLRPVFIQHTYYLYLI